MLELEVRDSANYVAAARHKLSVPEFLAAHHVVDLVKMRVQGVGVAMPELLVLADWNNH